MIAVLFTDGSCYVKTKVGGYGYIILDEKENVLFEFGKGQIQNTTNNEMELTAILEGLKKCKELEFENVMVFTDSQYSQKSITEWCKKWIDNPLATPSNHQLIRDILSLEFQKCEFIHIYGHSGNKWNERADKLASYRNE